MRVLMPGLMMAMVLLVSPPLRAQEQVEVVTLNYRTAEQLIPVIQPLVGAGGAVTGMQNKLIIRAQAAQIAQIKRVVATLDVAPRRLMITVRQSVTRTALEQEAGVYGSVGSDTVRARVPPAMRDASGDAGVSVGAGDDRVGARVRSTRDIEDSRETQRVQVLEGNPAFIRTGQSLPYRARTVHHDRYGTMVTEDTQFKDVTSGFYVLPRVSGDRVILEISPQRDTPGQRGAVNIQQASTVVSGRLGEWIELGGIGWLASQQGSGTVYATREMARDERTIFVRVEEVP